MSLRHLLIVGATAFAVAAGAVQAKEIVLKGVSYTPEKTTFSAHFERFIEKVNSEGKGLVQINYLGGAPKVMGIFEVGSSVSRGVIDIANVSGVFYTTQLPVVNATFLSEYTAKEMRDMGIWDILNNLHMDKMNVYYLARTRDRMTLNYFVNKKITKPDFSGLKIRSSTLHTPFIKALGGTPLETSAADAYSSLERGVVDGLGWPTQGVMDFRYHEVVKYRIDPGFYRLDIGILVNLDVWKNKLDDEQRAFLTKMALWLEGRNVEDNEKNKAAMKRQEEAGLEVIKFTGADCVSYLKRGYEAGWDAVIKRDPVNGPKLKELIYKWDDVKKALCD